ncbi:hypothetical protein ABVT39_008270, partial [Epinephelus coioides]
MSESCSSSPRLILPLHVKYELLRCWKYWGKVRMPNHGAVSEGETDGSSKLK